VRSKPPPAGACLFTSTETNNPVSDTRVRAHESSSLGTVPECEEGEPLHEERAAARGSAPLHLR
jgi:hypothetical protein